MNNQTILANRFREVILNGTWIANTNFRNELEDLDWEIATAKFQDFNTIANLSQHIHYYIKGIKNVFLEGKLEIRDKYSFDFHEIKSQDEWKIFLKLKKKLAGLKYGTYSRNIEAMIEHSYYHLGQLVLIKKWLKKQS